MSTDHRPHHRPHEGTTLTERLAWAHSRWHAARLLARGDPHDAALAKAEAIRWDELETLEALRRARAARPY